MTFPLPLLTKLNFYFQGLEWMLSTVGAVETTLKEDPRKKLAQNSSEMTILTRDRKAVQDSDSDSDDY